MRKLTTLTLLLFFFIAIAKNPIRVELKEGSEDIQMRGLLGALGASQVTANIFTDSIDARFFAIWMVNCKDEEKERTLIGYHYITPDSTTLTITTLPKDSMHLAIFVCDAGFLREPLQIDTKDCLLISCKSDRDYVQSDTIPIAAYTKGIVQKIDLGNGKVMENSDLCGLRYSNVHPSEWHKEFKLQSYIYFEAIPVKEITF